MDVAVRSRLDRPAWINIRTVTGLLIFALAFTAGQRMLATSKTTTTVWAAARDLPTGTVVGPDDLVPAEARLDASTGGIYLDGGTTVVGSVVTRPLSRGELIPASSLAPEGVDGRVITVPVAPEHAVGGELAPGDRVDIIATFQADGRRARSLVVARAVEITSTVTMGGLVGGEGDLLGVTVLVDPADAPRLAFAARVAEIDVVKIVGAGSEMTPEAVTGRDFDG